jgi:hypothetical protein
MQNTHKQNHPFSNQLQSLQLLFSLQSSCQIVPALPEVSLRQPVDDP